MTTETLAPQTLDDLLRVDGKAELINGRIVHIMPTGFLPCLIAARILVSLTLHVRTGFALGDGLGYACELPLSSGRQSFSPDASYYTGPLPTNPMRFIEGTPDFAVEVRSENDYGPAKDREYEEKRADYFEAGTQVVWDVDPVAQTITSYVASDPHNPTVFRRGDTANAEPAVPGWCLPMDALFV